MAVLMSERDVVEIDAHRVIAEWNQRPSDVQAIWLRCFHPAEADAIKARVEKLRPDVVLIVSHMVFGADAQRTHGRRPPAAPGT